MREKLRLQPILATGITLAVHEFLQSTHGSGKPLGTNFDHQPLGPVKALIQNRSLRFNKGPLEKKACNDYLPIVNKGLGMPQSSVK